MTNLKNTNSVLNNLENQMKNATTSNTNLNAATIAGALVGYFTVAAFYLALFGTATYLAWNAFMPEVFTALPSLSWLEAVGVVFLARIVFPGQTFFGYNTGNNQ